jgi:hypothetical protein
MLCLDAALPCCELSEHSAAGELNEPDVGAAPVCLQMRK